MNLILQAIKALLRNNRSDWKQNDPSQPDYIKNRPFYTDDGVLIPETTAAINEDGGYMELGSLGQQLITGETYIVILNGVTYKCVAKYSEAWECVCIGNARVFEAGDFGNDEPFLFDSYDDGNIYINVVAAGEYTFTFIGPKEIHKIPEKYLPDNIGGSGGPYILDLRKISNWYMDEGVVMIDENCDKMVEAMNAGRMITIIVPFDSEHYSTIAYTPTSWDYPTENRVLACYVSDIYYAIQIIAFHGNTIKPNWG